MQPAHHVHVLHVFPGHGAAASKRGGGARFQRAFQFLFLQRTLLCPHQRVVVQRVERLRQKAARALHVVDGVFGQVRDLGAVVLGHGSKRGWQVSFGFACLLAAAATGARTRTRTTVMVVVSTPVGHREQVRDFVRAHRHEGTRQSFWGVGRAVAGVSGRAPRQIGLVLRIDQTQQMGHRFQKQPAVPSHHHGPGLPPVTLHFQRGAPHGHRSTTVLGAVPHDRGGLRVPKGLFDRVQVELVEIVVVGGKPQDFIVLELHDVVFLARRPHGGGDDFFRDVGDGDGHAGGTRTQGGGRARRGEKIDDGFVVDGRCTSAERPSSLREGTDRDDPVVSFQSGAVHHEVKSRLR